MENCVQGKNVFIGKSSLVKNSTLGNETKIWHYCNIYGTPEQPVTIRENTQIGSYTEIKQGVNIGNNCRIQSSVFIPEGVFIEDFVFVGPKVVFTNDKYPSAVKTINKTWRLEATRVEEHATIGAHAVIGPGITVGKYAVIGMGSVVTKDVPAYAVVSGNPAKILGDLRDKKYAEKYSELVSNETCNETEKQCAVRGNRPSMIIPLVDLSRIHRKKEKEIHAAIKNTIETSAFIQGTEVALFENEFAKYCGKKWGVGVASGTDALKLAILAYGIKESEIITPVHTFVATVLAIKHTGNYPVLVDIDETGNIAVSQIEKKITAKTKAIIPVHLYGQPANMDEILRIAKNHNLIVIEDCCQAHGAEWNGKKVPIGETGCFSFYPSKNLGCFGDGGFIATDNEELYKKLLSLREYGATQKYYYEEEEGFNSRLDTIQAAVLRIKLECLEEENELRRKAAECYMQKLLPLCEGGQQKISIPKSDASAKYGKHVYHLFTILAKERNTLQAFLKKQGIATGIHYPLPLHLQKMFFSLGHKEGDFPITERFSKEVLSLPLFPYMTPEEIDHVSTAIKDFYQME